MTYSVLEHNRMGAANSTKSAEPPNLDDDQFLTDSMEYQKFVEYLQKQGLSDEDVQLIADQE